MLPSCHPSTIPSWSSPVCFIQLKTFLSIHRHKSRQRLYPIISLYIEMYINRPILMNFKNGLRVWKYVFHIADVTLISFLVSMLFRYHTIIHRNIKVVCSTIWIKFWKKSLTSLEQKQKLEMLIRHNKYEINKKISGTWMSTKWFAILYNWSVFDIFITYAIKNKLR